ncbi:MAG: hypothetical protein HYY17_14090 [Planctomycetes bacterium]|nr:hypothetical protein [Planctomycetota bacterium]
MKALLFVLTGWLAATQTVTFADCACLVCLEGRDCTSCGEKPQPAKPDC